MRKSDLVPSPFFILGSLFVTTNRLDTIMDKVFKEYGVTTKQWFLSIIVDSLFDKPPTMKEAARQMGCSHQNVKQVALKLKDKGLLNMDKDEKDRRITRISITEKSDKLWDDITPVGEEFLAKVYKDIDDEQLETVRAVFSKMMSNIEEMDSTETKK